MLRATTSRRWTKHRPTFENTAESFRTPSPEELKEVHEDRLRLVAAKRADTLRTNVKRAQSRWSAEKMAVANAMEIAAKLLGGESIKVSKQERYQALP